MIKCLILAAMNEAEMKKQQFIHTDCDGEDSEKGDGKKAKEGMFFVPLTGDSPGADDRFLSGKELECRRSCCDRPIRPSARVATHELYKLGCK